MPYPDSEYPSILRGRDKRESQRLLAAAPEMLLALMRARDVFEELKYGSWRNMDATYVDQLIESNGLLGCEQAIAKAEGRSE